jgi:hypothetical protein
MRSADFGEVSNSAQLSHAPGALLADVEETLLLEDANVHLRPRRSSVIDFASPKRAQICQLTDAAGGNEYAHVG